MKWQANVREMVLWCTRRDAQLMSLRQLAHFLGDQGKARAAARAVLNRHSGRAAAEAARPA
ncbi:hypothetical protein J2Z31_001158 [Sinorhizobium kostiense]|uniref:Uncharacterized protein n=1 Tax=Sinorhizobium kostiense TaxID=76747 RepID=A0ABS4QVL7_9HYPH|nr:hypothetical protein [Sinorhizobium kostiense]